jgi:hypothetical protein
VKPEDELRALRDEPLPPATDFVAGVMRQLATRPLPRRSWWRRLTAERELTVRVRPARLMAAACALAALVVAVRTRPRPTAVATVASSPRDGAPVLVRFALKSPRARVVAVAGDFNGWRPDANLMQRRGDGQWTIEVPLGPGNWSYSFVVDGQWVEDPAAESWRDDGFGGRNAIVRIGEATPVGNTHGS